MLNIKQQIILKNIQVINKLGVFNLILNNIYKTFSLFRICTTFVVETVMKVTMVLMNCRTRMTS